MIPVVSVVGKKKAGKTTLVVRLVEELVRRGYKVGTVKHDAHSFEIDREGKDSYKHFHAGAAATVITSDDRLAMVMRLRGPLAVPAMIERFFDPDTDLVVAEGFKRSALPKIEVYRRKEGDEGLLCAAPEDDLIAVASAEPVSTSRPVFSPDDAAGISDLLEERFGLRRRPR